MIFSYFELTEHGMKIVLQYVTLIAGNLTQLQYCDQDNIREFGNRDRQRRKTTSLIHVVYKPTHALLDPIKVPIFLLHNS